MIKYLSNKKYNKLTVLNIICLIIILIIILIIVCFLINYLYELYNKKSNFADLTNTSQINTIIPESTPIPSENKIDDKKDFVEKPIIECNAGNDVYGYCLNYDGCCGGTMKTGCFCKNPLVLSCKKKYEECMSDPNIPKSQQIEICGDKNKTCCSEYKNNIIDTNNFNKSVNGEQKDNIICSITNNNNMDTKCLELCQTDPNCVAYTLSDLSCTLHNKITYEPSQNKVPNKIVNNKFKFFTKK